MTRQTKFSVVFTYTENVPDFELFTSDLIEAEFSCSAQIKRKDWALIRLSKLIVISIYIYGF